VLPRNSNLFDDGSHVIGAVHFVLFRSCTEQMVRLQLDSFKRRRRLLASDTLSLLILLLTFLSLELTSYPSHAVQPGAVALTRWTALARPHSTK
jgi:hypothetical protein